MHVKSDAEWDTYCILSGIMDFITIKSYPIPILNCFKIKLVCLYTHTPHPHVQKAFLTKPKFDFTVLYGRDHLNAWSVVFAALLLIQGPLTASVWTKQNGTNAKEKFQVTKQTARHGASRLKSWWQLRDEQPFGVYECLDGEWGYYLNISLNVRVINSFGCSIKAGGESTMCSTFQQLYTSILSEKERITWADRAHLSQTFEPQT